jgi:ATP-dependent Clp protease adaptor protein ClpS
MDDNGTLTPEAPPKTRPAKRPKPDPNSRPRPLPPHAVVLHNDPFNNMDYVVGVLKKVFRYGTGHAFMLMLRAHFSGRSIVWTGTLEVAELKAQQVTACGPDPRAIARGAGPLRTSVEPLPD